VRGCEVFRATEKRKGKGSLLVINNIDRYRNEYLVLKLNREEAGLSASPTIRCFVGIIVYWFLGVRSTFSSVFVPDSGLSLGTTPGIKAARIC
jgi:hypothetical protein